MTLGSLAFFGVLLMGCKEKSKPASQRGEVGTENMPTVVDQVQKQPQEPKKEKLVLSLEQRAQKLGFAKHLPADTEMLLSVYDAKDSYERMKGLEVISMIMEENAKMRAEFDLDADEITEEKMESEQGAEVPNENAPPAGEKIGEELADEQQAEEAGAWSLLGQEVTMAFGGSSGTQFGHLLKMNERSTFLQFQMMGKAIQTLSKNKNLDEFSEMMYDVSNSSFQKIMEDPESGVGLIDQANFPPMYFAFRAEKGQLEQTAQMVSSSMAFFGMAGEMAAPVEIETGGSKFLGYKLIGAKIAEMMAEGRESMEEDLKPETVDALLAAISKKNMIFVTGTIDDYVVVMIGGDEKQMKLVSDAKDSLAANDRIRFVDEFGDKQILTVSYGEKEALKTMMDQAGGLASIALGFRDGISSGDGIGEMRDIAELLQLFAEREKSLISMASTQDFGLVAYLEEGLKIDSFGGHDNGGTDWAAPTRLAHLANDADNFVFINYSNKAVYNQEMREYLELMAEAAYALAMKFSSVDLEDPKYMQMKQYLNLFDTKFRDDMLGLYQAVSEDLASGLDHESAILIDMKGAMPAIPGIPQVIVDRSKAPRISYISPVKDRAKLASSWEKMDKHSASLLAKISEMSDKKIPMQKPISSKEIGMVTWFISMPFFQDNFVPSVTIHDDWFVASTSKLQAVDLVNKATSGGETGDGIRFRVNFKVLSDYADEMSKLCYSHADVLFTDELERQDFKANESDVKRMIESARQFDSMDWQVRKEDGVVRSRIHFKMN